MSLTGINTAADVANLVAKAFSSQNSLASSNNEQPDILSMFLRRPQQKESNSYDKEQHSSNQKIAFNSQEQQESQQYQQQAEESFNDAKQSVVGVDYGASSLISNVLKMIGFDASKLGALAINALIMIAQAVSIYKLYLCY